MKDLNSKKISILGKDYIITTKYQDEMYGEIIKAVSTKIKDFERIYFLKNNTEYKRIEHEEILKYIKEKYEAIKDDIRI